jgi:hypothetical protein
MNVKASVAAGGKLYNYNETMVRDTAKAKPPRVKTSIRACGKRLNHNETMVRGAAA